MIEKILYICLVIIIYASGVGYGEINIEEDEPLVFKNKILLFGCSLLYGIGFIPYNLYEFSKMIHNRYVPIGFFYNLYFTSKYKNLTIERLEFLNEWADEKPNNLAGRIWKYQQSLINKVNNYTHTNQ